jgi:cation:H+ antiporter
MFLGIAKCKLEKTTGTIASSLKDAMIVVRIIFCVPFSHHMELLLDFLIVIVGIIAVFLTAHYAIKSSINIAQHFKLSDEFIGMTILAIGTSLPEVITHIIGSLKIISHPEKMNELSALVIGTNVGSDIFQQNFLVGLVAVITALSVQRKHLLKDVGGLLGASVILLFFSYNGIISRVEGAVLFIGYILYLYLLRRYGDDDSLEAISKIDDPKLISDITILTISFIIMALCANEVLDSSVAIVEDLNISSSFFGIIVLGIAAALPELTTAITAGRKKKTALSTGVLIGSNVTNPLFALGSGALISTYTVPYAVIFYDLPVKIVTAILIYLMLWKGRTMKKSSGMLLIVLYLVYIYVRRIYYPVDF